LDLYHGPAPPSVVGLERGGLVRSAGDLGDEHGGVDKSAVRTLAEVGCHGVSGVADQNGPARDVGAAAHAADLVRQEIIDAGEMPQEWRGSG
jgi:hypothetical protein